jgi:hypothetical protein
VWVPRPASCTPWVCCCLLLCEHFLPASALLCSSCTSYFDAFVGRALSLLHANASAERETIRQNGQVEGRENRFSYKFIQSEFDSFKTQCVTQTYIVRCGIRMQATMELLYLQRCIFADREGVDSRNSTVRTMKLSGFHYHMYITFHYHAN